MRVNWEISVKVPVRMGYKENVVARVDASEEKASEIMEEVIDSTNHAVSMNPVPVFEEDDTWDEELSEVLHDMKPETILHFEEKGMLDSLKTKES